MSILKKKQFFLFFFLFILCTGLSAQSTAVEIENLLATDAVTYAQASRFVLSASGKLITQYQQEAFRYAVLEGWLPAKVTANQTARLDDISLLILNAFDINGGLFYSIANNSHYAYRELVYRNYIQGRSDPSMDVSGERLLFIIGKLLNDNEKIADDTLAAQEAARREAELAAQRESAARREAELAEMDEAASREAELAAQKEEVTQRETELPATDEADCSEADLAAQREESARLEAQLDAQRDEAIRLEAQLAAQREELARREAQLSNRQINTPVIYFTADNTVLSEAEKAKLREFAELLKNIPGVKLRISGYTAQAGTRAGRTRISLGRAQSVANYLISLGAVNAANITVIGYGAERPVASNATPRGMAANRRVEITILEN